MTFVTESTLQQDVHPLSLLMEPMLLIMKLMVRNLFRATLFVMEITERRGREEGGRRDIKSERERERERERKREEVGCHDFYAL